MDVVPCTCTYDCEYIQLPDVQNLTDEEFYKIRGFAWRAIGVSYVHLLTNFRNEKYSIELIQRDVDGRIVDATTIGVNDWFVYDPSNNYIWDVVENDDFSDQYKKVIEEVIV